MPGAQTWMAQEIRDAPAAVAQQERDLAPALQELVARLHRRPPQVVITCARGSSAHAAAFGKHLIERYLGIPVSPAAPSITSVYGGRLNVRDQLVLAISQSGRSDDLIAFADSSRQAGALTVAVTNDPASPLAATCDVVLPIGAGDEVSVAATKTFVATAATLLRLTAAWASDFHMAAALQRLPLRLTQAAELDWSAGVNALAAAPSLVAIGRGPTLSIAREAALKLKETCNLHAEAFSGAEFLHGPVALVTEAYPALMFIPTDAAAAGLQQLAVDLHGKGTALLVAGAAPVGVPLPTLAADQPEADAVCLIQSFYAMTVRLADALGIDVDQPRHLRKVTRTT